jgi:putative nucleotidyltransferase with HDIG domain
LTQTKPKTLAKSDFYRIPAHFYQPGHIIEEDLYFLEDEKFELFRPKNLTWNKQDDVDLEINRVKVLYIHCKEKSLYYKFLEEHLGGILENTNLDQADKASILYSTSKSLIEDLFNTSEIPNAFKRSLGIIKHSITYLSRNKNDFFNLMNLAQQDYSEYTHAIHVAAYSIRLAQQRGIRSFNHLAAVGTAALLHDVGKIKIDNKILTKEKALTKEEKKELQKHAVYGYELVRDSGCLPDKVGELILQHHEFPSGKGYPKKLKEDQISPLAQIISLAECYDSMRSNRPYEDALTKKEALQIIQTKYPQSLADDFIKIVGK